MFYAILETKIYLLSLGWSRGMTETGVWGSHELIAELSREKRVRSG